MCQGSRLSESRSDDLLKCWRIFGPRSQFINWSTGSDALLCGIKNNIWGGCGTLCYTWVWIGCLWALVGIEYKSVVFDTLRISLVFHNNGLRTSVEKSKRLYSELQNSYLLDRANLSNQTLPHKSTQIATNLTIKLNEIEIDGYFKGQKYQIWLV